MRPAAPRLLLRLAVLGAFLALRAPAQELTQSFELQPGWNAIWIEVDPPDRDPEAVFAGLPLRSVWTWSDRVTATDFIQNPGDAGWNRAQWLSFFPSGSPEAPLSNLRAVLPHRAYLVRLDGDEAIAWSVRGRPVVRAASWGADRYNLRGFPVDPQNPPAFRAFFRPSPAHFDDRSGQPEAIYALSPEGSWNRVDPGDVMRRGTAYWVYCRGASDFVAPFDLELTTGDTLNFDATLRLARVTLNNRLPLPKSIQLKSATNIQSPLLLHPAPLATNVPAPIETHDQILPASSGARLTLSVDRTKLASTAPPHTNVLSISDGEGSLFYVGVRALADSDSDFVGLWVGTVSVTNVAPAIGGGAEGGGAVPASFPLRLLLHVDASGQAALLREVTLLYGAANDTNRAGAPLLAARPTRLITDPALLAQLPPGDVRQRSIVGRRLSAPHFDFAPAPGQFEAPLTGTFALSNTVSATLSLPPDLPAHPFLHRYHPDHGTNRAYAITRHVSLLLGVTDGVPTGEGDEALGGTYSEILEGLHKQPLSVSGSLSLRRVSDVGVLNAP